MIDHLEINTSIVHRESPEGKIQLKALHDKGEKIFFGDTLYIQVNLILSEQRRLSRMKKSDKDEEEEQEANDNKRRV